MRYWYCTARNPKDLYEFKKSTRRTTYTSFGSCRSCWTNDFAAARSSSSILGSLDCEEEEAILKVTLLPEDLSNGSRRSAEEVGDRTEVADASIHGERNKAQQGAGTPA